MIVRDLKAKVLVFAVFFIGISTGILITNFYTTRVASAPDTASSRVQRAERDINKFYDYLGLNLSQREQMRKIGEDCRREFRQLRAENKPKFDGSARHHEQRFGRFSIMNRRRNTKNFASKWMSEGSTRIATTSIEMVVPRDWTRTRLEVVSCAVIASRYYSHSLPPRRSSDNPQK